ncbi:hypothetical protein PAMP_018929 [Pampus punctatissimus]
MSTTNKTAKNISWDWNASELSRFLKKETTELCPTPLMSSGWHIQYIKGLAADKVKPEWRNESREERWKKGEVAGFSSVQSSELETDLILQWQPSNLTTSSLALMGA